MGGLNIAAGMIIIAIPLICLIFEKEVKKHYSLLYKWGCFLTFCYFVSVLASHKSEITVILLPFIILIVPAFIGFSIYSSIRLTIQTNSILKAICSVLFIDFMFEFIIGMQDIDGSIFYYLLNILSRCITRYLPLQIIAVIITNSNQKKKKTNLTPESEHEPTDQQE